RALALLQQSPKGLTTNVSPKGLTTNGLVHDFGVSVHAYRHARELGHPGNAFPMKADKLSLNNFRCFEDITLEFSPHFNVIIGDNGSGKTALLRSLCVAVSSFLLGIDDVSTRSIQEDDIRLATYENNVEYQLPVKVTCQGTIGTEKVEWSRSRTSASKQAKTKYTEEIKRTALLYQKQVRDGHDIELPVIAYFPAIRIWKEPPEMNIAVKGSRLRGYNNALEPAVNYKFFTEWFKTKELASLQHKEKFIELQVVKRALSNCVEGCECIYYDINTNALAMKFSDGGTVLPVNKLSDGIKNMMAIVADIAYKCVTLNPHLKEKALESHGVVIIDELDLHLHPSWQKKVVADLKKTFPNIQFIAATHSPLIVSTITGEDRIILFEEKEFCYITKMYGRDVNDILRHPMDTCIKYKKLDEYLNLIELGQGESEEALALRKTIEEQTGADYHELARADVLIAFHK
ncbi:MAG: AAA family ATPase, partial [Gammaproteobacteria bacterium]|nr:AAA family ATPase [Gammaproteobacteria bacterium]